MPSYTPRTRRTVQSVGWGVQRDLLSSARCSKKRKKLRLRHGPDMMHVPEQKQKQGSGRNHGKKNKIRSKILLEPCRLHSPTTHSAAGMTYTPHLFSRENALPGTLNNSSREQTLEMTVVATITFMCLQGKPPEKTRHAPKTHVQHFYTRSISQK